MSSTSAVSPSQSKPPEPIPIVDIIQKLEELLKSLTKAKDESGPSQVGKDGKKEEDHSRTDGDDESKRRGGGDDGSKKEGEMDMHTQLDKACNELSYMIREFKKLQSFEADISEPLKTLEDNVKDIVTDINQAITASIKKLIERNLKVLRSNITKVKIQIPLQHQVSSAGSDASRYLQTTVASKEGGYLPDPYEAREIFDGSSFVKEFQDHYYKALDIRLKLCLLCFAIFPESAEVKERLLKFWWVGEKLRPEEKNFAKQTLGEFVEKGFIEPVTKKNRSRATSYKMHPIIRALIIKLAKEAIFFDYDSKGNPTMGNPTMDISASKKSCLVKSEGTTYSCFSKNVPQLKRLDSQQKGKKKDQEEKEQQPKSSDNQQKEKKKDQKKKEQQHQPKNSGNEQKEKKKDQEEKEEQPQPKSSEEKILLKSPEQRRDNYLAGLQTLFNVSTQFPELPEEVFSKMRNIGVLYLGRWERTAERHIEVENTKFLKGLKNMKKLLFFSLQGISGITKLEESVCKLSKLRILDLRACHNLEELPKGIGSLKNLTHLDLSECYLLDIVPKQLWQLSELRVLKGFVINKISSCKLEGLTKLCNLEKLSINVNDDSFQINQAGDVFFKFKELKKLKIAWGAGGKGEPKPTKGKKENNGGKSKRKENGEKKSNGNRNSSADKGKNHKRQENDAAVKSGATAALEKPEKPWGAGREESSKSKDESKTTAAVEKSNEVVKTKKKGSDAAAKSGEIPPETSGEGSSKSIAENKTTSAAVNPNKVTNTQDENRDAKKQGSDAAAKSEFKMLEKLKITCGGSRQRPPNKDEKTQESGMKLVKLDLQCFPERESPSWLVPEKLTSLERLYIKGGLLSNLCESPDKKWPKVEILRLKFLTDIKASWKELRTQFPKLNYLEKVNCPQITLCPCDANGVWRTQP